MGEVLDGYGRVFGRFAFEPADHSVYHVGVDEADEFIDDEAVSNCQHGGNSLEIVHFEVNIDGDRDFGSIE